MEEIFQKTFPIGKWIVSLSLRECLGLLLSYFVTVLGQCWIQHTVFDLTNLNPLGARKLGLS